MKTTSSFVQKLSIFPLLLIFSFAVQAQFVEPDEQIKREMIAYVAKLKNASSAAARPRIFSQTEINESRLIAEKTAAPSAAVHSMERQAFDILNEQRRQHNLPALRWSEQMARVARVHSANMAQYKFFSHQGRDNSMVYDRAKSIGVGDWQSMSENIAFNRGFRKPVEMACQHWMASTGHRANILSAKWTEAGIGAAIAPDGSHYFTQVFIDR